MGNPSLIFALILSSAVGVQAQGTTPAPRALTERVVATYIGLNDDKAASKQGEASPSYATLDGFFDYDALSAAPFKGHRKALKSRELAELQTTFRALITHLTHKSGDKLVRGQVTVSAARKVANTCAVDFEVNRPEDDITSQVTLVWQRQSAGWKVVDVAFDGASVTKDYENQFGRILKKDGAQALQNKLKERLAQVTSRAP